MANRLLSITGYEGNTNENYNELPSHPIWRGYYQKDKNLKSWCLEFWIQDSRCLPLLSLSLQHFLKILFPRKSLLFLRLSNAFFVHIISALLCLVFVSTVIKYLHMPLFNLEGKLQGGKGKVICSSLGSG
jgi:hypothetical protein